MANNFIPHPKQAIDDREQLKFKPDINNDNAVNVISANIEAQLDAILDALDVSVGESHFASASTVTTPNVQQNLITETVPAGKLRGLTRAIVTCRQEGVGYVYVNGSLVGSMRTSGANPNGVFEWLPKFLVSAGIEIKVEFIARQGSPIVDVEGYLQAVDKNI